MGCDLFGGRLEKSLSKKEAWKREHQIETVAPIGEPGDEDEFGNDLGKWTARVIPGGLDGPGTTPTEQGETEEHALARLGMTLGIRLWFHR